MRPTDELRKDHEILRAKLDRLEAGLPFVKAAPFTLLNLTRTIALRLSAHTAKEEKLITALRDRAHGKLLASTNYFPSEHEDQQKTLGCLLELLAKGRACAVDQVAAYASHLIEGLREHMANEEAHLFPMADRLVGKGQDEEAGDEHDGSLAEGPSNLAGETEIARSRHAGSAGGAVCAAGDVLVTRPDARGTHPARG